MQWLFLSVAIISEVIATSALKLSIGFMQLWPSLVVVVGGLRRYLFFPVSYLTHNPSWSRLRYLVWRRYRACHAYCLARFRANTRWSRYARTGAYRRWRNCPECVFQVSFQLTYYSP
jgi:Small Multidrug Resistance protein